MAEKTVAEYTAEREAASRPKKVAELSEIERAALGPAAVRAMEDSEAAQAFIEQKNAAAAEAAAKARAALGQLPAWIEAKALSWDSRGQRVEVEADHPPVPMQDGRVMLRLTRRAYRKNANLQGNIDPAATKLDASEQVIAVGAVRWLAVGGLLRVPAGKSVCVWCLHRPAGVALSDTDLGRGYVLDAPRQYGPGYVGEITIAFANAPDPARILTIHPGTVIALAELIDL